MPELNSSVFDRPLKQDHSELFSMLNSSRREENPNTTSLEEILDQKPEETSPGKIPNPIATDQELDILNQLQQEDLCFAQPYEYDKVQSPHSDTNSDQFFTQSFTENRFEEKAARVPYIPALPLQEDQNAENYDRVRMSADSMFSEQSSVKRSQEILEQLRR